MHHSKQLKGKGKVVPVLN